MRKLPEECVNLILIWYYTSFTDETWIPVSRNNKWKRIVNSNPYLHISLRHVCKYKIFNPPLSNTQLKNYSIPLLNERPLLPELCFTILKKDSFNNIIILYCCLNSNENTKLYMMMYFTFDFNGHEYFLWGTVFDNNEKNELIQSRDGNYRMISESYASEIWREQWGYVIPPLQMYM